MEIPLFQPTIGMTGSISPLPVAPQAPVAGTGPETMMAQVQAGAEERRRRVNQQTFEMGMQLTAFFAETITEARFHQGKRELMVGAVEIDPAEQREKIVNILEGANTMQYDQQGNVVYDHAQIANEITSISDLMLALELTNYEDWQTLFDLGMASLSEKVSEANGAITRRRLQRWLGEQLEDMKAEMSIKAARQYARETEAQFYNQFETAVNDGDIDTALTIIDQMKGFRMLRGPQEALMRNNVEQIAPMNILTNEMLSAVFRGDTQEQIEEQLKRIEKLTEEEGPILIQDEETGRFRVNRITPAQFANINNRTWSQFSDAQAVRRKAQQSEIDSAQAELTRMVDEGTLSFDAINSYRLLDMENPNATRIHSFFMDVVRAQRENDERNLRIAQDAAAQQIEAQNQVLLEERRNAIKGELIEQVQRGVLNPNNLSLRIQEMMAMPDDINGGRLFDAEELLTLQGRLTNILKDEYRNMSRPAYNYLNEILDNRRQAAPARNREEIIRLNNQTRQVFDDQQEHLIQQVLSGNISPEEYRQRLRNAVDEIISIDFDKSMIGDVRLDNTTMVLSEDGFLVLNQRPTENLIKAFQEGNMTLLGFTPVAEAQHRAGDVTRIAFQDIIMSAPDRITYETLYDANQHPLIRQPIRDLNVNLSNSEDMRSISNFVTQDRVIENADVVDFQVRIGDDGKAMLHILDHANNQWVSVQDLNDRQMVVLGVNPNYRRDERNIFQRVTQNIFDTPAPQTPQDRLRELVFQRDELQELVDRGPDRTPASTNLIGIIRRYGLVLGAQTRSRENVLRALNREIETLQRSIERSRSEAEQRRGM